VIAWHYISWVTDTQISN